MVFILLFEIETCSSVLVLVAKVSRARSSMNLTSRSLSSFVFNDLVDVDLIVSEIALGPVFSVAISFSNKVTFFELVGVSLSLVLLLGKSFISLKIERTCPKSSKLVVVDCVVVVEVIDVTFDVGFVVLTVVEVVSFFVF